MCNQDLDTWQSMWEGVEEIYKSGNCVSEWNLQAVLYKELSKRVPRPKPQNCCRTFLVGTFAIKKNEEAGYRHGEGK